MEDLHIDLDMGVWPETCEEPSSDSATTSKYTRRSLTLSTKMEILKRLEGGESAAALGRIYNINESTVRSIRNKKEALLKSVQHSSESSVKVCNRTRDPMIEKMEHMLSVWIESNNQNSVPLTSIKIRKKALKIYDFLKESELNSTEKYQRFQASKGWFEKFKKRQLLMNAFDGESITVDNEAAISFVSQLKSTIESEHYSPQQVFNMTEIELYWKKLPSRTFITIEEKRAPGFKASRDRLTLMLCANTIGDYKCKPLVVYHSIMPRALKGVHNYPVHWRANKRGWMTPAIVEEWLIQCFSKEVELYCKAHDIPFKILLILDTSPFHPPQLGDLHPNINVLFLPPCTATILQPLDLGVSVNFKLCYILQLLTQFHEEFDKPNKDSVREFWKNFNIRHALEMINIAWDSVTSKVMNGSWKTLWEESVFDPDNLDQSQNDYIKEIVKLGRKAGFKVFEESDVKELIETQNDDIHEDELDYLIKGNAEEIERIEEVRLEVYNEVEEYKIKFKKLMNFLKNVNEISKFALDMDPSVERSVSVKRKINEAADEYLQMYLKKSKKKNMNL